MNRRLHTLLLLAMTVLMLCSCVMPGSSMARTSSIIQDPSCFPPCWENIRPGITQRKEVKGLLAAVPWIKKDSIKDTYTVDPNDSVEWTGASSAADYWGRIFFNNDVVTLLFIDPNNGVLKFSDLISKLGQPEKVMAEYRKGEVSIMSILILYPDKGFGFYDYYNLDPLAIGSSIQIRPDEGVKLVWYCEPKYFYNFMKSGQIDRLPADLLEEGLQNWNGYSDYQYVVID